MHNIYSTLHLLNSTLHLSKTFSYDSMQNFSLCVQTISQILTRIQNKCTLFFKSLLPIDNFKELQKHNKRSTIAGSRIQLSYCLTSFACIYKKGGITVKPLQISNFMPANFSHL